ncbi:MAG TPA: MFS transporter [Acidimicrobiales bacterium]|nr:MFS transporter [Acidimicrobiales bacterium]
MAGPDESTWPAGGDETTARLPPSIDQLRQAVDRPSTIRLFNTQSFFRLWLAQVVSSLGDWIGFVAVTAIAARIGGKSPETAISLVLSARLLPGFFLAPWAGVLVDRWDRKKVMVTCDIGRGTVLAFLPFVHHIYELVFASLLLEMLTLLWSPAKEASVPNIVQTEFLANANSLSLAAAYGTFPIGSFVFTLLAGGAKTLSHFSALHALQVNQESLAIWADTLTFFTSALMISTLALPRSERTARQAQRFNLSRTFDELREGWRFIGQSPTVRSVMLGLATGLFGGGMVVPLGPIFVRESLNGGSQGFGALLTALGFGVALSVIGLTFVQKRLPHERVFVGSVLGGGVCMLLGASSSSLTPALLWVFGLGLCAGGVYVLGFTILQTNVEDELRGRIFATLYTLIRMCLLLAFTLAPVLAKLLGTLSNSLFDGRIDVGVTIALPGARLALWMGGAIILMAGVLSALSLRPRAKSSS